MVAAVDLDDLEAPVLEQRLERRAGNHPHVVRGCFSGGKDQQDSHAALSDRAEVAR